MKKAGIITLFGEYNFGNRLQNYAVQEVLRKRDLEVETFKYIPKNGKVVLEDIKENEKNRLAKFKKFNQNIKFADEVLYSDLETPENFGNSYDYIVLGGDQIWNHTFKRSFSDKAIRSICTKA